MRSFQVLCDKVIDLYETLLGQIKMRWGNWRDNHSRLGTLQSFFKIEMNKMIKLWSTIWSVVTTWTMTISNSKAGDDTTGTLLTKRWNLFTFMRSFQVLCDKVCQWLAAGRWFSSTNKTACHDITVILLKVALNTITLTFHVDSKRQRKDWNNYRKVRKLHC
jgi:hypothetical protein